MPAIPLAPHLASAHNLRGMADDGGFRATGNQPSRRLGGATGRGFMPGRSGNPGGRPRGIEARCREFTEEALQALVMALANPKERVQAAQVLLGYAWGKPKQVIEANAETSATVLHLLACQTIGAELHREGLLGETTSPLLPAPQPNVILPTPTE